MTNKHPEQSSVDEAKLWDLAASIRIAMLTTRTSDTVSARPMYALVDQVNQLVRFITEKNSVKITEAQENPKVMITFSNGTDGDHAVLHGTLNIIDDKDRLAEFWNPGADLFFPKGATDPNAVLLEFEPATGEFWSGGSGLLAFAINYAKAKFTGVRPEVGDHAKLNM